MSASPTWAYDGRTREYYYWDPSEQCYTYQSGRRVDRNGELVSTSRTTISSTPRTPGTGGPSQGGFSQGSLSQAQTYQQSVTASSNYVSQVGSPGTQYANLSSSDSAAASGNAYPDYSDPAGQIGAQHALTRGSLPSSTGAYPGYPQSLDHLDSQFTSLSVSSGSSTVRGAHTNNNAKAGPSSCPPPKPPLYE